MKLLIKGGRVVDPVNSRNGLFDVLIEDGIITEISEKIEETVIDTEVIDATGLVVAPGFIDMHCHLREPGFEYKETIETGTKSAVKGGFTSVACMPNTKPVTDNATVVEFINKRAKETAYCNVFPIGAITKGLCGEELAEIGEMKFAGIVGISDDGRPVENANVMRRAMVYAGMFDTVVISHCEELSLVDGGSMNEGTVSTLLGLRGISKAAEEVMVARDINIAENTGEAVHIAHVSTRGSVELVRSAKKRGVKVTCETCPHYFSLTEEAVEGFNTNAKMNPPLRTKDDVAAIKEGILDGTIDAIATDHAPHHRDEKELEFEMASNGIVGFETALPLAVTELLKENVLTLDGLVEKMSVNPAKILGLNKGSLAVNKCGDITIFNPDEKIVVDVSSFESKSKNSPYNGYELFGKVQYTIVGGKVVVRNGQL